MLGGQQRVVQAADFYDVERKQQVAGALLIFGRSKTPHDLKDHQVGHAQVHGGLATLQPRQKLLHRPVASTTKVINPDAGINQDHLARPRLTGAALAAGAGVK